MPSWLKSACQPRHCPEADANAPLEQATGSPRKRTTEYFAVRTGRGNRGVAPSLPEGKTGVFSSSRRSGSQSRIHSGYKSDFGRPARFYGANARRKCVDNDARAYIRNPRRSRATAEKSEL